MGHIRKRIQTTADGKKVTRYQARWIDVDGRERAKTFSRQEHAKTQLLKQEAAVAEGRPTGEPADARLTVGEWLDRWLDLVAARVTTGELAATTAVGYDSHVRLYLTPRLGSIRLKRLRPSHVDELLGSLQADGRSPGTARSVRATLSKALTDAMRDELVDRNVAQIAKPPTVRKKRPSAFTDGELAKLGPHINVHRLGPMFLLSVATGLRTSELLGLRWDDIDLAAGTLTVTQTLHRITKAAERVATPGLYEGDPKTHGSAAPIPLAPYTVAILRAQRHRQDAERAAATVWRDTGYVFTTTIGTPLEASNVASQWRTLVEAAGVPYHGPDGRGRGLHEPRRTFATRARTAGVALEDVQRLGRWTSPAVLLGHYAATPDDRLRTAAAAVTAGLPELSDGEVH